MAARAESPLWTMVLGLRAAGWEVRAVTVGDPSLGADDLIAVPPTGGETPSAALPAAAGFERAVVDAERLLDAFRAAWSDWRPASLLVEAGFGGGLMLPRELQVPCFCWCERFEWPVLPQVGCGEAEPVELAPKFGRATDLLALTAADRVLVPSHHSLRSLPSFCAGRARIMREPVATSRWMPADLPREVRDTGAVAPKHEFVVFLGDAGREDGSGDFLRAMESVWTVRPGVQAWLVGHDEALLRRHEAEAWPAGQIRFLGSMPAAILAAFFNEAAAVVCLSRASVPGEVLRAMASGACVIGLDTPAFREVVRHRENGMLVGQGVWGDLASELMFLLRDPAAGGPMRAAARRLVVEHHSESATATSFARLVAECGFDYPEIFGFANGGQ